jgi:maltose alpha-D-glucosyltransferase/alpha-amylase
VDEAVPHVLAVAGVRLDDGTSRRYSFALTGRPLRVALPGDGAWRALAVAMDDGRTFAGLPPDGDPGAAPTAVLICRPAGAMVSGVGVAEERALGADQSNTSVVIGQRLLLKAFRRLQPGLNPELELGAYLSEEAGFAAVPPLAGFVELVSSRHGAETVAVAQAFIADGADAYESLAEALKTRILAPDAATVAKAVDLEVATQPAADLGTLTAGLHAALARAHGIPDLEPRDASRRELRAWDRAARGGLARAMEVVSGEAATVLRDLSPRIAQAFEAFEASATLPLLTRIHADYHLGQVLISPDGLRIVDFEGDPLRTIDERRALDSPLRDVASMLRSMDHLGRSAGRRAVADNGGPVESPGLDVAAWLRRSRERFLAAYRVGLREADAPIVLDPTLLRAFELDKECREFIYAVSYLPSWIWAPTEGMRGLFGGVDGVDAAGEGSL